MIRSLLAAGLVAANASVALADTKKDKLCAQFGVMSGELASLRKEGKSEKDAMLALAETYKDEPAEILQLIPYLSSFVYGLPKAQLDEDVAGAMTEQCKAA